MIYRFYLTIGSTVTEVFPLNFLESKLIDEQEGSNIFYRRKFSGTLSFVNNNGDDDFDLLYFVQQNDPCGKILFEVKRDGVSYWVGYFSVTDGKFDLDREVFEVTPLPDDDYEDLMEKVDDKYNIINVFTSGLTEVTVTATKDGVTTSYTRNRWIYNPVYAGDLTKNLVEYLADKIVTGVTVSSTFFTNATNPATLADSHVRYLTIAQKSDIIRPSSSDRATEGLMSWTELMDILWGLFQVKWDYIPGTGTINVEHISFWSPGAGMDLRTQLISKAGNKFSYIKEKMPKYEKFSFMEALSENFKGLPIWYDSKCVDQNSESNTKEISIPVTTDLEYIMTTPLEIADEGWVILCNEFSGGVYSVEKGLGALHPWSSEVRLNMHLSWANLHNAYYRHERILIEGSMNNVLTTFWTAQNNKGQECFAIVCPSDSYDPSDAITTQLGETYFGGEKARVAKSELDPHGLMDFSLVYGEPDTEQTPIEDSKWIQIIETACGEFEAELSEAADADLAIVIKYIIYDADMVVVCSDTVDGETWTIPTGEIADTFALTLCDTIPEGGCIRYTNIPLEVTGHDEWPVGVTFNDCNCE